VAGGQLSAVSSLSTQKIVDRGLPDGGLHLIMCKTWEKAERSRRGGNGVEQSTSFFSFQFFFVFLI